MTQTNTPMLKKHAWKTPKLNAASQLPISSPAARLFSQFSTRLICIFAMNVGKSRGKMQMYSCSRNKHAPKGHCHRVCTHYGTKLQALSLITRLTVEYTGVHSITSRCTQGHWCQFVFFSLFSHVEWSEKWQKHNGKTWVYIRPNVLLSLWC